MQHYFTPPPDSGGMVSITGQDALHLARVLRVRAGGHVTVTDGMGGRWKTEIVSASTELVEARVVAVLPAPPEPAVGVTLFVARSKADKWEHVLQKAVELGAVRLTPFSSSRCVGVFSEARLPRLRGIAREAAMQSGRGVVPTVDKPVSYAEAVGRAAGCELALFCYEEARELSLRMALSGRTPRSVAILTGPEGGFSHEEAAYAKQAGCLPVSLGPRILRCETAPLAALTMTLALLGEMEPQ